MNKDRELREILTWFFERHPGVTVGQAKKKIKALYKPLKIEKLNPVSWYRNDWEKVLWNKVNEVIAIINARGER